MGLHERRQREKEETRQRILDASLELFLKEGLVQVSLRRIATEIEYSPAAIYRYFSSRDEILWALCSDGFDKLRLWLEKKPRRDPRRQVRRLGLAYLGFASANPQLYDLMFLQTNPLKVPRDDPRWAQYTTAYQPLRAAVRACQAAGYLKGVSAEAVSFSLWSMVHGMVSLVIKDRCLMYNPIQTKIYGLEALNFILKSIMRT